MFRVKLSVPQERVLAVIERIKTGIRGVGYVRLDDSAAWPEWLDRPFPGLTTRHGRGGWKTGGARASPRAKRPPPPNRKRRPPDLDEGDAMASPSAGISTPPDRDTVPVASVRGVSHTMGPPCARRPRSRHPRRRGWSA